MFKKSQLLVAVATAAAACFGSSASATDLKAAAYTDLRYGLDYFNDTHSGNDTDLNFNNHNSYYGFKGSAEQAGITVFGAYERWLDADPVVGLDVARQSYVGVKGAWGTVQYGTFGTAYMESGRKLDPFYATGAAGVGNYVGFLPSGGQSHGLSFLTADLAPNVLFGPGTVGGFVDNQLQYTTPSLFGVTVNVGTAFDDSSGQDAHEDFTAGAEFNNFGITAGVQWIDANSQGLFVSNTGLPADTEALRLYAAYNQKRFGVGVSSETIDLNAGANDQDYLMVSGWFGVLEGVRVAASFGMENETGVDGQSLRAGVFYDVLDNFTTHVAYRMYNSTDFANTGQPDDQVITVGASYKFELSGSATK